LQNVTLNDVDVYYSDSQTATVIALHAGHSQIAGRFSSQQYSLSANWQGAVQLFSVRDDVFIRDKALDLSGILDVDSNTFIIRRSNLTLAKVEMSVSGGFTTGDGVDPDLLVESKPLDYASLMQALPDSYKQKLNDYPGKGNVSFAASIRGKGIPCIEAQFGMTQGQITHRQSNVRLTGM
jgi:hypothetical protein